MLIFFQFMLERTKNQCKYIWQAILKKDYFYTATGNQVSLDRAQPTVPNYDHVQSSAISHIFISVSNSSALPLTPAMGMAGKNPGTEVWHLCRVQVWFSTLLALHSNALRGPTSVYEGDFGGRGQEKHDSSWTWKQQQLLNWKKSSTALRSRMY